MKFDFTKFFKEITIPGTRYITTKAIVVLQGEESYWEKSA